MIESQTHDHKMQVECSHHYIISLERHTVSTSMPSKYGIKIRHTMESRDIYLHKITVTHRPLMDISKSKPKLNPVHRQQYYNTTTLSSVISRTAFNTMTVSTVFTGRTTADKLADNTQVKSLSFPYSLPSVGPRTDPSVQAVSPQVTISHPPGGRLPLLSARPAVTFPAAEHHRPLAGTKLYCLLTETHRCEQPAQGCYAAFAPSRI